MTEIAKFTSGAKRVKTIARVRNTQRVNTITDGVSDLEAKFDYYWRIIAQDYPKPMAQYKFERWVIDRAFPEYKIAIELNGGSGGGYGRPVICHKCGSRVRARKNDGSLGRELRLPYPSHAGRGAERDAEKSNALQAAGWVVLTFTSQQLKDPERVIQAIVVEIRKSQIRIDKEYRQPTSKGGDLGLSRRELQVLSMVCQGLTYGQIASAIGVEPSTVRRHVSNIKTKMKAPSQAAACALGVAMGLVDIKIN